MARSAPWAKPAHVRGCNDLGEILGASSTDEMGDMATSSLALAFEIDTRPFNLVLHHRLVPGPSMNFRSA